MNKRLLISVLAAVAVTAVAADQPQWGEAWTRNMVSAERGLPSSFDPKTGENIRWSAALGTQTFSTPVVGNGRVYIGTNNDEPRDPKHQGDRGVLMCFDEKTGNFLWQLVVPKREDDPYCDWPKTGMSSPATVEGERVYIVNNRGEVMCLDAAGMKDGNNGPFQSEGSHMVPVAADVRRLTNDQSLVTSTATNLEVGPLDADVIWSFDLTKGAGIWSHDAAHSSILIDGDYLYLNSGTGVDNTHRVIQTPNAPSLVVLNKHTGEYVARDDEHIAPDIFHCTWSSPAIVKIRGKKLIILAAGNGIIYAFEIFDKPPARKGDGPSKLKKVWQFDFDPTAPKQKIHEYLSNRKESPSNIYGMPVVQGTRIYVAGGGDVFWGKHEAWLKCIDATKTGDVTKTALIWSYPLNKHVLGTPAVYRDCVFIADTARTMHCVDAKTGKAHWTDEIKGEVWASPMVVDGKVYLGMRNGDMLVYEASKEKKLLRTVSFGAPINATAIAANRSLYVATMSRLYCIASGSNTSSKTSP